jgi:hypothetical protein
VPRKRPFILSLTGAMLKPIWMRESVLEEWDISPATELGLAQVHEWLDRLSTCRWDEKVDPRSRIALSYQ